MSQLTLSSVLAFVRVHIPDYHQSKVGVHLNLVIEDVYERLALNYYSTFTTRVATTAGTVSVTAGATTVTFSTLATLATTDGMRVVQIDGDSTWYVLTRTSGTVGELSSKFAGATNATASFKIAYPTVTFPAAVGTVLRAGRTNGSLELDLAAGTNRARVWDGVQTGMPTSYAPYAFDADGTPDDAHRIILQPWPTTAQAYEFEYDARPTLVDPASVTPTTEKVAVPTAYARAVEFGTLALCWLATDQESSDRWGKKAEDAFQKAIATKAKEVGGRRQGIAGRMGRFVAPFPYVEP